MDTNKGDIAQNISFGRTSRNYINSGRRTTAYSVPSQSKDSSTSILSKIRGFLSSLWSNGEKETDDNRAIENVEPVPTQQQQQQQQQQVNITRLHYMDFSKPSHSYLSLSSSPATPTQSSNIDELNFDQLIEKLRKGGITQTDYDRITSLLRSKVISDNFKPEQRSVLAAPPSNDNKTVSVSAVPFPPGVRRPTAVQSPIKYIIDFGNLILDKTKPSRLQARQQIEQQRKRIPSFSETYKLSGSAFGLARPIVQTPNVLTSVSSNLKAPSPSFQTPSYVSMSPASSLQNTRQTSTSYPSNPLEYRPMFPRYELQNEDDIRRRLDTLKRGPPQKSADETDELSPAPKKRTLENRQSLPVTPYLNPHKNIVATSATVRKIMAELNRFMSPVADATEAPIDFEPSYGTVVDISTRRQRLATRKKQRQEFLKAEHPDSDNLSLDTPPSEFLTSPSTEKKRKKIHTPDISSNSQNKIKTEPKTATTVEAKRASSASSQHLRERQDVVNIDEYEETMSAVSNLQRKRKKPELKSKQTTSDDRMIDQDSDQKNVEKNEPDSVVEIVSEDEAKFSPSPQEMPRRKKAKIITETENVANEETASSPKAISDLAKVKYTEPQRKRVATAFDDDIDKIKVERRVEKLKTNEGKILGNKAVEVPTPPQDWNTSQSFSFAEKNHEKEFTSPKFTFDFSKQSEQTLQFETQTSKEDIKPSTISAFTTDDKNEKRKQRNKSEPRSTKQDSGAFGNYFEILASQEDAENEKLKDKGPTKETSNEGDKSKEKTSTANKLTSEQTANATTPSSSNNNDNIAKIAESDRKEQQEKFATEAATKLQDQKQEQENKDRTQTQSNEKKSTLNQEEKEQKELVSSFVFTAPLAKSEEKYRIEKPSTDTKEFSRPTTSMKIDVFTRPITENTYPLTFSFGVPTTTTDVSATTGSSLAGKEESKSFSEAKANEKEESKTKTTALGFPAGGFAFLPSKDDNKNLTTNASFGAERTPNDADKKKGEDSKPPFNFFAPVIGTNDKSTTTPTSGFNFATSTSSTLTSTTTPATTTTTGAESNTNEKSTTQKAGTEFQTSISIGGSVATTQAKPEVFPAFTNSTSTAVATTTTPSTSSNKMDEETMNSEETFSATGANNTISGGQNQTGVSNQPAGFRFETSSALTSFTASSTTSSASTTGGSTAMFVFGANSRSKTATASSPSSSLSFPTSTTMPNSYQFGQSSPPNIPTSGFGTSGTLFSDSGSNNLAFNYFGSSTAATNFNFMAPSFSTSSSSSSLPSATGSTTLGSSSGSSIFGGGGIATFSGSTPMSNNSGSSSAFGLTFSQPSAGSFESTTSFASFGTSSTTPGFGSSLSGSATNSSTVGFMANFGQRTMNATNSVGNQGSNYTFTPEIFSPGSQSGQESKQRRLLKVKRKNK